MRLATLLLIIAACAGCASSIRLQGFVAESYLSDYRSYDRPIQATKIDPMFRPVAGAEVKLLRAAGGGTAEIPPFSGAPALTTEGGALDVEWPGRFEPGDEVLVSREGYLPVRIPAKALDFPQKWPYVYVRLARKP